MTLRVHFKKDVGKFIIQKKCFFFWCSAGHWSNYYKQIMPDTEYFDTEEEAKESLLKMLEYHIFKDKLKKQYEKFSSGYQPIVVPPKI